MQAEAPTRADSRGPSGLVDVWLPVLISALAIIAGGVHLVRNYLPMGGPPPGGAPGGGPPAGAEGPPPDAGGLMSLVMPHLSELFIFNFVAFVVLAVAVWLVRRRLSARVLLDALLVVLSAATLYAWNATGRVNPSGTGTLALIAELALIVVAIADAIVVRARGTLAPTSG